MPLESSSRPRSPHKPTFPLFTIETSERLGFAEESRSAAQPIPLLCRSGMRQSPQGVYLSSQRGQSGLAAFWQIGPL